MTSRRVLVVDAGTSGVRAAVVDSEGRMVHEEHRQLLPRAPRPGWVEFDAAILAETAVSLAGRALAAVGGVDGVGITNQRSSTVVWDRSGEAVGPGLGWQDLRTVEFCGEMLSRGHIVTPNQTASKAAWLLEHASAPATELCVGTVDSWIAWHLSGGTLHVTDVTNASTGGMWSHESGDWNDSLIEACGIPRSSLPEIVDTSGVVGAAAALEGTPPLAAIAGDQQASLVGQGCASRGRAKITFGTGGMADLCVGNERPEIFLLGPAGTAPFVACQAGGETLWLLEGVILAAGTNVEWLRDGLGIVRTAEETHELAAECETSEGVVYVPALHGLGTPYWDLGAHGTFFGLRRDTRPCHLVRAVLEGVAQRAADLVEAAEGDSGLRVETLNIDGGMSTNPTFVQAVADAVARPVDVAEVIEATVLGAAYLAGAAVGIWPGWGRDSVPALRTQRFEPKRSFDRDLWKDACSRIRGL